LTSRTHGEHIDAMPAYDPQPILHGAVQLKSSRRWAG
jgi:hypothetical protein